MSARDRVDALLDPGSFLELDRLARGHAGPEPGPMGDGVITGLGEIAGRQVAVFAQDFTVMGGSLGATHGRKIIKLMDAALDIGCPVISINDSAGARIQEGVAALAYYAQLGERNVRASGVVPQIALIDGPCAGGAAYSPALMDLVVMVDGQSSMFITGPDVARKALGEEVPDDYGSPQRNAARAGNCHYVASDEQDALDWITQVLGYLPDNCLSEPPGYADEVTPAEQAVRAARLARVLPAAVRQPYDMHEVVEAIVDADSFLEVHELFAPNLLCGFARLDGRSVGVVANQPMYLAGAIDVDASEKGARFVRLCDCFGLPVITLVDVPGYLPGTGQEDAGIVRRGAKLLHAYAEATVPRFTVVLRKAYGGAYAVMGSKHLGATFNVAWPTAEIAVMGAQPAVDVLARGSASGPERERLIGEYSDRFLHPYAAADLGYIDDVILPEETRPVLVRALRYHARSHGQVPSPRRHSNIPL